MTTAKPMPHAPFFWDEYGIQCVECPKCRAFIPNVLVNAIVQCPLCALNFKVIT